MDPNEQFDYPTISGSWLVEVTGQNERQAAVTDKGKQREDAVAEIAGQVAGAAGAASEGQADIGRQSSPGSSGGQCDLLRLYEDFLNPDYRGEDDEVPEPAEGRSEKLRRRCDDLGKLLKLRESCPQWQTMIESVERRFKDASTSTFVGEVGNRNRDQISEIAKYLGKQVPKLNEVGNLAERKSLDSSLPPDHRDDLKKIAKVVKQVSSNVTNCANKLQNRELDFSKAVQSLTSRLMQAVVATLTEHKIYYIPVDLFVQLMYEPTEEDPYENKVAGRVGRFDGAGCSTNPQLSLSRGDQPDEGAV